MKWGGIPVSLPYRLTYRFSCKSSFKSDIKVIYMYNTFKYSYFYKNLYYLGGKEKYAKEYN